MKNHAISFRLILMNFMQYAIWGAYLISMGSYLNSIGSLDKAGIFYAMQGIVSIFMPALIGIIADKLIPAQKVLSLCHGLAGVFMIATSWYATVCTGIFNINQDPTQVPIWNLFTLYSISVAFYMPTIALSNSVAFTALGKEGKDTVKAFPPIRVFGTIGFICSMLFVNYMTDGKGEQYQQTYNQFLTSGILGIILAVYSLTLPDCPIKKNKEVKSFMEASGLKAFTLFKSRQMAIFFIFSMLLGVALQITNTYANPFITSFKSSSDLAIANSYGAQNANALISISQLSETLCILLIPFFLKKFGIKKVMLISMFAWVFRFGLFGAGNPGPGVWMFILSMIIYGVAFDFFNISGSLYVNEKTTEDIRSSAQGLFMLMTNGFGATIGTLSAQQIVNHLVVHASNPDWSAAWYIFAGYSLIVAILFMILFKDPMKEKLSASAKVKA